jgi:3D (Asp-Asp-Asp) domain-containing protein
MWKRAMFGAFGSRIQIRLRRLLAGVLVAVVAAVVYPLATPNGASQAGDTKGDGLLAPPIGGSDGRVLPEVQSTGMFFPRARPALAVTVTPPPPPPKPSATNPPKPSTKSSPTAERKRDSAQAADPDDLGIVLITCYTMQSGTASGEPPDPSTAATSPGFLPLGTVISIEGVGTFTVKDRGPLGRKIDIWMASDEECTGFGKQYHRVRVLSRP